MSEPIWTHFTTRVPMNWPTGWMVAKLDEALRNGSVDVEEFAADHYVEVSASGEGNYGLHDSDLEVVMDWCQEHRVPYVAHDESKYDCQGEIHVFDGDSLFGGRFDQTPVLDKHTYDAIVAGRHEDFPSVAHYFATLDAHWDDEDSILMISHLPVDPPDEED